MLPADQLVKDELERRLTLWRELQARGGPDGILPELIKQLRIHRGEQGVFRDSNQTSLVSGTQAGITVGLLHTGRVYADDLSDDGVIYHYPSTRRPDRHDANEIAATKACGDLGLPLYVVLPSGHPRHRNVRLGWVVDYDDESKQVLISFSEPDGQTPAFPPPEIEPEHFILKAARVRKQSKTTIRPNQTRFRFEVMKRYGKRCAVCEITYPELLDAAHICPVEENGCDDPRNGLVFCLNHHRAFDRRFFSIDPEALTIRFDPRYAGAEDFAISRASIGHLKKAPHPEALRWAWGKALKRWQVEAKR